MGKLKIKCFSVKTKNFAINTYRDKGWTISEAEPSRWGQNKFPWRVTPPDLFKWGRPMEFESKEDAEKFLDEPYMTGDENYKYGREAASKNNPEGPWAVYKYGGFSGDMSDEYNNRKGEGWHMYNFNSKEDAENFANSGNYSLQLQNSGGGTYHVKKDDKSTIPYYPDQNKSIKAYYIYIPKSYTSHRTSIGPYKSEKDMLVALCKSSLEKFTLGIGTLNKMDEQIEIPGLITDPDSMDNYGYWLCGSSSRPVPRYGPYKDDYAAFQAMYKLKGLPLAVYNGYGSNLSQNDYVQD